MNFVATTKLWPGAPVKLACARNPQKPPIRELLRITLMAYVELAQFGSVRIIHAYRALTPQP
jgi:hypothetical protein